MFIKEIDRITCIEFVQKYHYSKVMPVLTKHYLGLFKNDELVGALTLGWGTQPVATIRKILPNPPNHDDFTSENYLEIGKMCIHPDLQDEKKPDYEKGQKWVKGQKSAGSQFLSLVIWWIKKHTEIDFLYTLADGIVGRVGYVYQSFNFYYGGYFDTPVYMGPTGEKIHPRTTKWLCRENERFLIKNREIRGDRRPWLNKRVYWLTPDFMRYKGIRKISGRMFRYMKPLNKKAKKILDSYPNWKFQKDYPKEKDLVWRELVEKGKYKILENFNTEEFHLDVVDVNKKNVYKHVSEK